MPGLPFAAPSANGRTLRNCSARGLIGATLPGLLPVRRARLGERGGLRLSGDERATVWGYQFGPEHGRRR